MIKYRKNNVNEWNKLMVAKKNLLRNIWGREITKFLLNPMLRWSTFDNPKDGYSIMLGVPWDIAYREKNSLQYSSGLHRAIRLLARKNGYTNKKGKSLGYESGMKAFIMKLKNEVG